MLKNTYKKLFLKYQNNARFPSLCLASENVFLSYFYSKNGHNWVEKYRIRINLKLVLKTTWKKLFLKYQDNARFPSLCLVSENSFLSYFYSKISHNSCNSERNYLIKKRFTLVLKRTYKKVFLNTRTMRGFRQCLWPLRIHIWTTFTQKTAITHQKMTTLEKN